MEPRDPVVPPEAARVRRHPERECLDRAAIERILDEALICHVGIVDDGAPVVIPMLCARDGADLLLHGSPRSRLLQRLAGGAAACAAVTLLDGIVLARSAMHHSLNYRSVVAFGRGRAVIDPAEKRAALDRIMEHVAPGRLAEVRAPSAAELEATLVVRLAVDQVSAKVRTGPPVDAPADLALPCFGGVVPLALAAGPPIPDSHTPPEAAAAYSWRR